jgi:preprotein translocase subunit YajC
MNTPLILVILIMIALLVVFLIRFYWKKNRQDLQKLKSELKKSNQE